MGDFRSTAAAYKQLRPIEDNTLNNLLKAEQIIASREGRRAKKEKVSKDEAAKKEAALNKSLKDSGLYKSLDPVITGVKTVDEINSLHLSKVADERLKVANQIKSGEISANDPSTASKISKLNNSAKDLKAAEGILTQNVAAFEKAYQNGEISEWDKGKRDKFSAFFGVTDPETGETTPNYAFVLDERGNSYAVGKTQKGDRVTMSVNDVISGNMDWWDVRPPVDYIKDVSNYATKLGDSETTTLQGPYKVTEQDFDTRRDEVIGFAEMKFGDAEEPTDFAKSVWSDEMGEEPEDLTKEGMDKMKNNYVQNVENFYDEKYKKVLDPTFERKQKRMQEDDTVDKNFIRLNTDVDEVPLKSGIPGVTGDIGGPAYSFSLPKNYKFKYGDGEYEVDGLYLTEDGQIAFAGTVKKKVAADEDLGTTEVKSERFAIGGSDLEELEMFNKVAGKIKDPKTKKGFENISKLRDELIKQIGIPKKDFLSKKTEEGKDKPLSGKGFTKKEVKEMSIKYKKTEDEMRSYLEDNGGDLI